MMESRNVPFAQERESLTPLEIARWAAGGMETGSTDITV